MANDNYKCCLEQDDYSVYDEVVPAKSAREAANFFRLTLQSKSASPGVIVVRDPDGSKQRFNWDDLKLMHSWFFMAKLHGTGVAVSFSSPVQALMPALKKAVKFQHVVGNAHAVANCRQIRMRKFKQSTELAT